jgi:RimJ/RimL family protein N-acetyltransferase
VKTITNELGQQIGYSVKDYISPPFPNFTKLEGASIVIEPIEESHQTALYKAFSLDSTGANWTYLPYGPFLNEEEFRQWAMKTCFSNDPKFYTIINEKGPTGVASYLRIEPKVGCIEIGYIHLSPLLQRTRAGTEALLLMIEWAFEVGYRRVEWKCDALNNPSRKAAERLGLSYEGMFRQATIYKSRNRDTVWYAATSLEWPSLKEAYHAWRNPHNFDALDKEIEKLSTFTKHALISSHQKQLTSC